MQTLTQDMTQWTTKELWDEVMRRTGSDGPTLHLLETILIRARLAESDRRFADFGRQAEQPGPDPDQAGVLGTMEMSLADDRLGELRLPSGNHEVAADTAGAHTHDHTHRRVSSTKFAAHNHHHLHPDDAEADALLNGHSHARAHARHPWESANPA
jgi:hypothetical protein